jgi:B12-binding domain/radical SAM domain protein
VSRRDPIDLLLLHPPSVYDFRTRSILYGPVSDVIPSSTVFEMYPLGFLTLASYLHERGLTVRIVNLALRMMSSRRFDVSRFLAQLKPRAIGIDLHWMPHCHGALEIARLAKEIHPHVPVIFGGLSSTYYHRELIEYPQVDFVLRGDSTEPMLHRLLTVLREQAPGRDIELARIANLTWKRTGDAQVNLHTFVPSSLDYIDLRPDLMVEMVLRYRDLESVLPFHGWWRNPITTVLTVKGCSYQCVTCGSSATTCEHLTRRAQPAYRSPASVVSNMQAISRLIRGPIFLIGDVLQPGEAYARELLERLRQAHLPNETVFEFFTVPPAWFLPEVDHCVPQWSIEFSPESQEQAVRDAQEGETGYSNEDMERFLAQALSLRCHRVDVFFMIGLPAQTLASVHGCIDYCERLMQLGDARLSCFISPMGPFSDPGSRAFEEPERFGYRLFARTLEEHRQLLTQPTWERILNYETRWMTRAELVDATYDAAERLNELKMRHGRISRRRGRAVAQRIHEARALRARLDAELLAGGGGTAAARLRGEIARFSISTVCDKRELFWRRHALNFKVGEIARIAARYFLGRSRVCQPHG